MIRYTRTLVLALTCLLLATEGPLHAELWPTLAEYVEKCVLIIRARVVSQDSDAVVLEVEESWKGQFDPRNHDNTTPDGRIILRPEHGLVDVHTGQRVVLFFTHEDHPQGAKLSRHSTAFPVRDGKVVYASTSDYLRQKYSLSHFKQAVAAVDGHVPEPK